METISLPYLILIIALIISVLFLFVQIFNELQNMKLERRFDAFSMVSNQEQELSFLDNFLFQLKKLVKKVSFLLKKSHVFSNYGNRYEKYSMNSEEEGFENVDFVAFKLLIGFFFVFLNFLSVLFRFNKTHPISYLLAFLFGFFLLDFILFIKFHKKKEIVETDLLKAIIIMNNSFKSGKNIMQAISTVKNELEGPIADEFKKIYLDITYGLSLEVVFERFYERVKLEDAKYIASSLTLLNKTGGNIVEVFGTIEKNFFHKKRLQDELKSLTASSIFVYRILTFLPIVFSFLIFVLNPTYFHPFFASFLGISILSSIVLLYILYIRTVRKVMKVKM